VTDCSGVHVVSAAQRGTDTGQLKYMYVTEREVARLLKCDIVIINQSINQWEFV